MSDLIDRQDAIDAFWKLDVELRPSAIDAVLDMLKSLPSAEKAQLSEEDATFDCISRQAAIDATWEEPTYSDPLNVLTEVRDRLKDLPPESPDISTFSDKLWKIAYERGRKEGRKKGKWIQPCDITGFGRCSNCNALWDNSLIENRYFKHCPRCGADMREGEQE